MNWQIAIPSFDRATIIKEKTLSLLKRLNIENKHIVIFVETDNMKEEYNQVLEGAYNIIATYTKGICEKRNYLHSYYYEQTVFDRVIMIDDDIENIMKLNKKNPKVLQELDENSFKTYVKDVFRFTEYEGLSLWGVSTFHNPFFLSYNTTRTLKQIPGAFQGICIRRDRELIHCDIDHMEDSQFSLEYFLRDGGLVRSNHICLITKYFEEQGGIAGSLGGNAARKATMEPNALYLKERYGDMVELVHRDYGWEVKLNWRYIADDSSSEDE